MIWGPHYLLIEYNIFSLGSVLSDLLMIVGTKQIGVVVVVVVVLLKRNPLKFSFNTFYLRLNGVGYMIEDQSDNERGNPLPAHRILFPISSKGSFICIIPQTE